MLMSILMTMRDMEKVKVWIPICIDPLGHLCEQALYNDVETVYKYVHNLWPTNIFIYGESSMDLSTVSKNQLVGSSPSCYIAANHPEGIVGLILHSALLSGIKSKKIETIHIRCSVIYIQSTFSTL